MEKSLPWTEGHFPAESSLARSVYVNKPRADNSASACSLSYPKKSENVRSHSSNSIENATPSSGTSPLASYKEEPSPAGALGTCCCFRRLKIAWNSLHIFYVAWYWSHDCVGHAQLFGWKCRYYSAHRQRITTLQIHTGPRCSKYAGVTCHALCDPGRHCCLFGVLMRDIYLTPRWIRLSWHF